jgi:hypothetical protein
MACYGKPIKEEEEEEEEGFGVRVRWWRRLMLLRAFIATRNKS